MSGETMEAEVFELFARAYPHEAAEQDWPAFVQLCQKRNPALTETAIKKLLTETDVAAANK